MPRNLPREARLEWRRVAGLLKERRVLDGLDEAALSDYITCWLRLRECEADIAARGVLVDGTRGKVKNPSVQVGRQYREALMRWTAEFGLSPMARERVKMPAPKPVDDPWDAFD